jgi:hypothetical protein
MWLSLLVQDFSVRGDGGGQCDWSRWLAAANKPSGAVDAFPVALNVASSSGRQGNNHQ